MISERRRQLYGRAIEAWGDVAQVDIALEEIGELLIEINRHRRGRSETDDVVDEIADVRVMTEQLAVIFGEDDVEQRVEEKIDRLEQRLETGEWSDA